MSIIKSKNKRNECEDYICKVLDIIDKEHINSKRYREIFSKMTNEELLKFSDDMESWEIEKDGETLTMVDAMMQLPHSTFEELSKFIDANRNK